MNLFGRSSDESARAGQRKNKKSPKDWWIYLVLGLVTLAFIGMVSYLIYFHYSTFRNQWELEQIEEKGIEVPALILKKQYSDPRKGLESWTLKYKYTVDGREYKRSKYVDSGIYGRGEIGDTIQVRYLPGNPKVSDFPGNYGLSNEWITLVIFDVFMGIIGIVLLFKLRRIAKEERDKNRGKQVSNP